MASAVGLRRDYSAVDWRGLARRSSDAAQVRRLLALAVVYAGGTRREAALAGGVGLQTVRDWVLRFSARGPDGLIDSKAPGKVALLSAAQRQALARLGGAECARQYHVAAAAAQMPRTEPGRERLAIPARQLALEHHLHILRRHRRSVLQRLEHPRRATIPDLLDRIAPMGAWVKINEDWYEWRRARRAPFSNDERPRRLHRRGLFVQHRGRSQP